MFSNQQVGSHARLPAALADASCFPLSSFLEMLVLHKFLPRKANREESYSSAKAKEGRYFYVLWSIPLSFSYQAPIQRHLLPAFSVP